MKTRVLLFINSLFLVSCGIDSDNQEKSSYFDFELQIDTVQVDSRNEIIMTGANMANPAVSFDKTKFYNFDNENYLLEVFDIENYRLDQKVNFQKEGPNGLGSSYSFTISFRYAFLSFHRCLMSCSSAFVNSFIAQVYYYLYSNKSYLLTE